MRLDKKNADGLILCVLLQDIAVPVIDVEIDENEIRDAILTLFK
jgi:3-dehydroquinate synthetase